MGMMKHGSCGCKKKAMDGFNDSMKNANKIDLSSNAVKGKLPSNKKIKSPKKQFSKLYK